MDRRLRISIPAGAYYHAHRAWADAQAEIAFWKGRARELENALMTMQEIAHVRAERVATEQRLHQLRRQRAIECAQRAERPPGKLQ